MGKEGQLEVVNYISDFSVKLALFDGFENFFGWTGAGGVDGDFVCSKSSARAYNGDYSLLIQTPATTPGAGDYVRALRGIITPETGGKVKVSALVNITGDETTIDFIFHFLIYSKGRNRTLEAGLKWDGAVGNWKLYTTGSVYTEVVDAESFKGGLFLSTPYWSFLSFEFNIDTEKYTSVQVNDQFFSVPDIPIAGSALSDPTNGGIFTYFYLETLEAAQKTAYIDDVNVVVNSP